jgi:hypothetical protein
LAVQIHSRAEQYRHWAFAAQQRATEAQDPKIKVAYEEVANGWFALAAQADRLVIERAPRWRDDKRNKTASVPMYRPELLLLYKACRRYTGECGMLFLLSELPLFACLVVWVTAIVLAVASLLS